MKNEDCVDCGMKEQMRIQASLKHLSLFTAIFSTSEHSKYFLSMLQYKLLSKNGERADEDFMGYSSTMTSALGTF